MHILRLPRNQTGRDFVVGDIHGHFDEFEQLLQQIRFNPASDRMLCVGDYIDRGPHSERALYYLEQDWFFSVRGNHEAMLAAARDYEPGVYELWMRNGGEWAEKIEEDVLDQFADIYEELPYVIEVEGEHGKIGVVHADVPPFDSWDDFTDALEADSLDEKAMQAMLWSRATYRRLRLTRLYPGIYEKPTMTGVHSVYLGHSIVAQATRFGSYCFIDTGAYANGQLTVVDINSEEIFSMGVMNFAVGY